MKVIKIENRGGFGFVEFDNEAARIGWCDWPTPEESGGRDDLFAGNWGPVHSGHFLKAARALKEAGLIPEERDLRTSIGILIRSDGSTGIR